MYKKNIHHVFMASDTVHVHTQTRPYKHIVGIAFFTIFFLKKSEDPFQLASNEAS